MVNKKNITIWIVILLVIFFGFYFLSQNDSTSNVEDVTEKVNYYEGIYSIPFTDYDDNEIFLSDFNEQILVVNSWATWCPFCREELPDFVSLQKKFEGKIMVVAIDRKESLEKSKGYTDNLLISNDILYLLDEKDLFYNTIGGFSMPETIFIDKDKNVFFHKRGFMKLDEMIDIIEKSNLLSKTLNTDL